MKFLKLGVASRLSRFYFKGRFEELDLHPLLKHNLRQLGFQNMTEVQHSVIPYLLASRSHTQVVAETGSGKTLAFLVPLVDRLLKKQDKISLVLCHCKQLSFQTYTIARQLGLQRVLRLGSLYYYKHAQEFDMGQNFINQKIKTSLKDLDYQLVVATPVQITQVLLKSLVQSKLGSIVIDEADLMTQIDENLMQANTKICRQSFRFNRTQIILNSAFYPARQPFLNLSYKVMKFAEMPKNLSHFFIDTSDLSEATKLQWLYQLLVDKEISIQKPIIFCNQKQSVLRVCQFLKNKGITCIPYFADLSASQRLTASRSQNILVSTDVGSRGLDFTVSDVVQFQLPKHVVAYINRVGRTARANRIGRSYNFQDGQNKIFIEQLKSRLKDKASMSTLFSRKRSFSKKCKQMKNKRGSSSHRLKVDLLLKKLQALQTCVSNSHVLAQEIKVLKIQNQNLKEQLGKVGTNSYYSLQLQVISLEQARLSDQRQINLLRESVNKVGREQEIKRLSQDSGDFSYKRLAQLQVQNLQLKKRIDLHQSRYRNVFLSPTRFSNLQSPNSSKLHQNQTMRKQIELLQQKIQILIEQRDELRLGLKGEIHKNKELRIKVNDLLNRQDEMQKLSQRRAVRERVQSQFRSERKS